MPQGSKTASKSRDGTLTNTYGCNGCSGQFISTPQCSPSCCTYRSHLQPLSTNTTCTHCHALSYLVLRNAYGTHTTKISDTVTCNGAVSISSSVQTRFANKRARELHPFACLRQQMNRVRYIKWGRALCRQHQKSALEVRTWKIAANDHTHGTALSIMLTAAPTKNHCLVFVTTGCTRAIDIEGCQSALVGNNPALLPYHLIWSTQAKAPKKKTSDQPTNHQTKINRSTTQPIKIKSTSNDQTDHSPPAQKKKNPSNPRQTLLFNFTFQLRCFKAVHLLSPHPPSRLLQVLDSRSQ